MSEFQDQKPEPDHYYTVELRFMGETLDPAEITALLTLPPSTTCQSTGACRPNDRRIRRERTPFWGYDGHDVEGYQYEWPTLEEGLSFVLKRIRPLRAMIIELSHRYHAFWWCGHFQSSFCGGPTLSPKLLAELASYGIELDIDTYYNDPYEAS